MIRKTLSFLPFLVFILTVQAQTEETPKDKKLSFGVNLGLNYSNLSSKGDSLPNGATFSNALGYKLGIMMDYAIIPQLLISPKAELSFNKGKVNFQDPIQTYEVLPTSLDVMLHVILRSKGNRNFSPYAIFGPNFRIPLQQEQSTTAFSTQADVALDFGFGLEKAFKKFSFTPEFRYSLGLSNINGNPLLESVYLHTMSLNFILKK